MTRYEAAQGGAIGIKSEGRFCGVRKEYEERIDSAIAINIGNIKCLKIVC